MALLTASKESALREAGTSALIDRIEYGDTVQISAQQHGVCERVRVCVRARAV